MEVVAATRPAVSLLLIVGLLAGCSGGSGGGSDPSAGAAPMATAGNMQSAASDSSGDEDDNPADQADDNDPPPSLARTPDSPDRPVSVSFSTDKPFLVRGEALNVSWRSEDADSCTALGGPDNGSWNGQQPLEGSALIPDIDETMGIGIRCASGDDSTTRGSLVVIATRTLSWEAPTDDTRNKDLKDLAGYDLYYGTTRSAFTSRINIPDPSQTSLELDLPAGTYYMALAAYDRKGTRSDLSNEIVKIVP